MPTTSKTPRDLKRLQGRRTASKRPRASVRKTLIVEVTASKAREELSNWISIVSHGHKWVILQRHGRPAVAMVPIADLEALRQLEDTMDLQAAREAMSEPGQVPWKEVKARLGL